LAKCINIQVLNLEAYNPFEHPKTVLLSKDVAEDLGFGEGDVVKIFIGSKTSVAKIITSRSIHKAIALKYSLSLSLGIAGGEDVEICMERVSTVKAKRIVLRPETNIIHEVLFLPTLFSMPTTIPPFTPITFFGLTPVPRDTELKEHLPRIKLYLKRLMFGAPYIKGDYVIWSGNIFALTEAIFRVTNTYPDGVVTIASETEVEIETT